MQRVLHFLLGHFGRLRQPLLVLEQLHKQESW
jgi:hypothetical protein